MTVTDDPNEVAREFLRELRALQRILSAVMGAVRKRDAMVSDDWVAIPGHDEIVLAVVTTIHSPDKQFLVKSDVDVASALEAIALGRAQLTKSRSQAERRRKLGL